MSDVKFIKVYGVISDPGLTFTQSPTINEKAGPLTFTSALHQKIQVGISGSGILMSQISLGNIFDLSNLPLERFWWGNLTLNFLALNGCE